MKGGPQSPPPGAQRPPTPWYQAGWRSVHVSVAGAATLIVLGLIIAKLDALAWRRNHVPERDYTTFLFPCEVRAWSWPAPPRRRRERMPLASRGVAERSLHCWGSTARFRVERFGAAADAVRRCALARRPSRSACWRIACRSCRRTCAWRVRSRRALAARGAADAPCNTPLTLRCADLLVRMTTPEKLGLLSNTALGVPRLFIPPYQWRVPAASCFRLCMRRRRAVSSSRR